MQQPSKLYLRATSGKKQYSFGELIAMVFTLANFSAFRTNSLVRVFSSLPQAAAMEMSAALILQSWRSNL